MKTYLYQFQVFFHNHPLKKFKFLIEFKGIV